MFYDEMKLFAIVPKENIKKGCVVRICTTFNDILVNTSNKILIVDNNKDLKAVWYEEEYAGKPYLILDYQIITEIIERDVNVEEYLESINLKTGYETKSDKSFLE